MKKFKRNYENMVNGYCEFLKDYEPFKYRRMEIKGLGTRTDEMVRALDDIDKLYSSLEKFLTEKMCNERVERIWAKSIPYRVTRISMGSFEDGVTKYNIVRSLDSFTKIFQEICRFFSWNGDKNNDMIVGAGDTLHQSISKLNHYFQTVKVIYYNGPERLPLLIIALGNIVRDMYLQALPKFGRRFIEREEYNRIKSIIDQSSRYPEYHTEEDNRFIETLPAKDAVSVTKLFDMVVRDTGLDTMIVDDIKGIDEIVNKLEEMEDRWRAEYNKDHPYTPSNSNAHAYQLESSYDLFSDD